MKKVFTLLGKVIALIALLFAGFVMLLTVLDYDPEIVTKNDITSNSDRLVENEFSITTWNLGYAGLSSDTDFFLDGGKSVTPSAETTTNNLNGMANYIAEDDSDIYILQEVDIKSKRAHNNNMHARIQNVLSDYSSTFATNFKVLYLAYPFPDMIGQVEAGISTFSKFKLDDSSRIGFDINYSWPKKIMHLDRALSVNTISIKESDAKLIVVNLHLSAYDDGGLRAVQLADLKALIESEYAAGNYVIAGGDFNQMFPTAANDQYPTYHPELYLPNLIDKDYLSEGWTFIFDDTKPTYRLLNEPYNASTAQIGVIDGFITSPNLELISAETVNMNFKYSDHNPVKAKFRFK
jgi:endonuclease/exonuclease/phosphatase family metal-dependent hydrolase